LFVAVIQAPTFSRRHT